MGRRSAWWKKAHADGAGIKILDCPDEFSDGGDAVLIIDSQGDLFSKPNSNNSKLHLDFPELLMGSKDHHYNYETMLELIKEDKKDMKTKFVKFVIGQMVKRVLFRYLYIFNTKRQCLNRNPVVVLIFDYKCKTLIPKLLTQTKRRQTTGKFHDIQKLIWVQLWDTLMDRECFINIFYQVVHSCSFTNLNISASDIITVGHTKGDYAIEPLVVYDNVTRPDCRILDRIKRYHGSWIEGEDAVMSLTLSLAQFNDLKVIAYSNDSDLRYASFTSCYQDNAYILAPASWINACKHKKEVFSRQNEYELIHVYNQKEEDVRPSDAERYTSHHLSAALIEGIFLGGDFNLDGVFRFKEDKVTDIIDSFEQLKLPMICVCTNDIGITDYTRCAERGNDYFLLCHASLFNRWCAIYVLKKVVTDPVSYITFLMGKTKVNSKHINEYLVRNYTRNKSIYNADGETTVRVFEAKQTKTAKCDVAHGQDDIIKEACRCYTMNSLFMVLKIIWGSGIDVMRVRFYQQLVTDRMTHKKLYNSLYKNLDTFVSIEQTCCY